MPSSSMCVVVGSIADLHHQSVFKNATSFWVQQPLVCIIGLRLTGGVGRSGSVLAVTAQASSLHLLPPRSPGLAEQGFQ